jgi:hypothetical protein
MAKFHRTGVHLWVNKAASESVYTGRHLFGARQRKDKIVGTIAEPRIQRRISVLLDPYTIAIRSQNITSGNSRGDTDGRTGEHTSETVHSRKLRE